MLQALVASVTHSYFSFSKCFQVKQEELQKNIAGVWIELALSYRLWNHRSNEVNLSEPRQSESRISLTITDTDQVSLFSCVALKTEHKQDDWS